MGSSLGAAVPKERSTSLAAGASAKPEPKPLNTTSEIEVDWISTAEKHSNEMPATVIEVIHISDVHFGPKNIARPSPGDEERNLAELLLRDFQSPPTTFPSVEAGAVQNEAPLYERILCVSGDLTQSMTPKERQQATEFLTQICEGFGWDQVERRNRVIMIPGNHDLLWKEENSESRWEPWRTFHNDFYGTSIGPKTPFPWTRIHEIPAANVVVLCLDSEHHIYEKSPYRQCGIISERQISHIEALLSAYDGNSEKADWFREAVKIAMVHHHPLLIPSLVEPGRGVTPPGSTSEKDSVDPGYDAIFDAQRVLALLHRYGFQLLLHGHKHMPHVFTEDIVNACHNVQDHSMVFVAGGTLGSDDAIPVGIAPGWTQTYNRILVHWNPGPKSSRVAVDTRGLIRTNKDTYQPTGWSKWSWKSLRVTDRFSNRWMASPVGIASPEKVDNPYRRGEKMESKRVDEYNRLKSNMPVVDVRPSLVPGQGYEVKFWVVGHRSSDPRVAPRVMPSKVVWSAGEKFPRITITREEDERFCGIFHCYGPMSIMAELYFQLDEPEIAYIYASLPDEN